MQYHRSSFFFSSRRRHTRSLCDWSSDVCSSDLQPGLDIVNKAGIGAIRDKSMRMTLRLIEGARSRGWRVNTPENPAERAGTVSVECPHAYEVSQIGRASCRERGEVRVATRRGER